MELGERVQVESPAAMIRARRGEPVDDWLARFEAVAAGSRDAIVLITRHIVQSEIAMAAGRLAEAREQALLAARASAEYAPSMIAMAARAAIWPGDAAGARGDLEALGETGTHGPAVELRRKTIQAGLAALDGRPHEALMLYREVLRGCGDLRLAWDEALTAIDMAMLLDPAEPAVQEAADAARGILSDLGARPYLARLEAALARVPVS